mgnify:CR=1 FL=1
MIVCICKSITVEDIENYLETNPDASFSDVIQSISVANDCGICAPAVIQVINNRLILLKSKQSDL